MGGVTCIELKPKYLQRCSFDRKIKHKARRALLMESLKTFLKEDTRKEKRMQQILKKN